MPLTPCRGSRRHRQCTAGWEPGFHQDEVDDFLDRVHAELAR